MKRLFTLAIIAVSFAFVGCSGDDSEPTNNNSQPDNELYISSDYLALNIQYLYEGQDTHDTQVPIGGKTYNIINADLLEIVEIQVVADENVEVSMGLNSSARLVEMDANSNYELYLTTNADGVAILGELIKVD